VLFSLDWLLQLCPADRDVDRIASLLTDRGLTVDAVEPRGSDHVLEIDVPANRPDCLGHLGVAREISAALGAPLLPAEAAPEVSGTPTEHTVRVEIADPALCPRYAAGVIRDVRVGPSPDWVVRRLEACGLRSVNNVVDASNVVMLQLGQPIHFFDLDRLATSSDGTKLVRVRTAKPDEILCTLDGIERRLRPDMLLITDAGRAAALAGVMGGADTEIGPTTRHVMVEAAHFDPGSVRRTARRLALQTDASYRFERGVDPEAPVAAQALAARLLHELAGGGVAPGIVDAHPAPLRPRHLTLHPAELRRLLGFAPAPEAIRDSLAALQLSPEEAAGDAVRVTVPSWRRDLEREADLVEEVARHLGYDRIPIASDVADVAGTVLAGGEDPSSLEETSRDLLAPLGFHEAVGYAMIGSGEDDRFVPSDAPSPLALANPIAEPLAHLRRSVLPGLLRATDLNLRRGNRDVRLFEVGGVFLAGAAEAAPTELPRLGLAWSGSGEPAHWSRPPREVDLFDAIGVVELVLGALRPGHAWTRHDGALAAFHPARSVRWASPDGTAIAWGGALHPELRRGLDQEVFLLELALDAIGALARHLPRQRAVPRVPAVTRDLSLVLTREVTYARILDVLAAVAPPAPAHFAALDRYEGSPLGADEIALTVRVTLEPLEQTLTDDETERYRLLLVQRLRDLLGVRIRS
jgi:phenylalanyl-tRNA synthetase beta chain